MYYHQKDVYTSSAQPVESNYEYHNSNDNGYVGMNQAYEQRHVQTSQRFTGVQNGPPVTRTQESGGYNGNSYGNEFVMSRTSNFKSSSGVPENMQVVDSQVTSKRYVPPRNDRKSTTKVVTETLDDGTVISRQIVVEEEDTLIERRLYKYEATSPHMNRKLDPAQAMAVQTGIHQAAEYGEDEDELTDKFSRYEAELEARRRLKQNGGHSGSNPGGMDSEDGRYVIDVDCACPSSARNHSNPSQFQASLPSVVSDLGCGSSQFSLVVPPSNFSKHDKILSNMGEPISNSVNRAASNHDYRLLASKRTAQIKTPVKSRTEFGAGNPEFETTSLDYNYTSPAFSLSSNNISVLPSKPKLSQAFSPNKSETANFLQSSTSSANYASAMQNPQLKANCYQATSAKLNYASNNFKKASPSITQYMSKPYHAYSTNVAPIESRSVKSVKGMKSLNSKARSSSHSSLTRKKLEAQSRRETSIDDAIFDSKMTTRSKSQPVISTRSLNSLIPYPKKVLPKDSIQPVNELSSTGYAPIARNAYHPYRSVSASRNKQGELNPNNLNDVNKERLKNSRSLSEKRLDNFEAPKSLNFTGNRRRNLSELVSPVESRIGIVADTSSDCSSSQDQETLGSVIWNEPKTGHRHNFSDGEGFDPQSDSGIDLPGKSLDVIKLITNQNSRDQNLYDFVSHANLQSVMLKNQVYQSSKASVSLYDSSNRDKNAARIAPINAPEIEFDEFIVPVAKAETQLQTRRELPGRASLKGKNAGDVGVCLIQSFCEPTNYGDDFELYENCSSLSSNPHLVSVSSQKGASNFPFPVLYSYPASVESCSHVKRDVNQNYFSLPYQKPGNNYPSSHFDHRPHHLLTSNNQFENPHNYPPQNVFRNKEKDQHQQRHQDPKSFNRGQRDRNSNSNSDGSYNYNISNNNNNNQFPSPSIASSVLYTDPNPLKYFVQNESSVHSPNSDCSEAQFYNSRNPLNNNNGSLPRDRDHDSQHFLLNNNSRNPNCNNFQQKPQYSLPGNLEFKNPHHNVNLQTAASASNQRDLVPFQFSSNNKPDSYSDHFVSPQVESKYPPSYFASNKLPPTEREFDMMDPESKLKLIRNLTDGDYALRTDYYSESVGSLRKSDSSRISPQVDSTTVRAAPRSLQYNESFKHASNEGLFPNAYEGNESSPRNKAAQPMIMHGRNNNDSPSMSSNYTYDLPGGTDFNRRQNGHTTIRVTETTTTHGFPLLSGGNRQKSTPDVSRNVDSDYVANYDNTNLVAKQRGFKMSADNLVDEDVMVVRETKLQQHSVGGGMMDFTPKPSPKPKVLPTQRYAGPPQSGSSNK